MSQSPEKVILHRGKHVLFVNLGGWEYVERAKISGIVAIVAVTADGKMIFVEQYRPPVQRRCIELPAGLAGDIVGQENEALETSARRELLEETGYEAESIEYLAEGAASAGICNEIITLFMARGLKKVEAGGGDGTESIQVHEVPLDQAEAWLAEKTKQGAVVDLKVYGGIYFAKKG